VYYTLLTLCQFLILFSIILFSEYVLNEEVSEELLNVISLPGYIIWFIIIIKRLHDINYRGWWSLFFPIFLVLPFIPWTKWDNRFWNESKVNNNILNPLFIVSLFLRIIWIIGFIGFIVFATLLLEEETTSLNTETNTQIESIVCWKNSAKNEEWSCSCLSWYQREDYNDENNLDCVKSK